MVAPRAVTLANKQTNSKAWRAVELFAIQIDSASRQPRRAHRRTKSALMIWRRPPSHPPTRQQLSGAAAREKISSVIVSADGATFIDRLSRVSKSGRRVPPPSIFTVPTSRSFSLARSIHPSLRFIFSAQQKRNLPTVGRPFLKQHRLAARGLRDAAETAPTCVRACRPPGAALCDCDTRLFFLVGSLARNSRWSIVFLFAQRVPPPGA